MLNKIRNYVFSYDKRNWKLKIDYNPQTSQFDLIVNMEDLPYRAPTQGQELTDCLTGRIKFN